MSYRFWFEEDDSFIHAGCNQCAWTRVLSAMDEYEDPLDHVCLDVYCVAASMTQLALIHSLITNPDTPGLIKAFSEAFQGALDRARHGDLSG